MEKRVIRGNKTVDSGTKGDNSDSQSSVAQPQQVEEASVAKFFESNSNIGANEAVFESDDTRMQRQNLAVIRKLLAMFNMDETRRKYEAQNVVEFVLDPNDFGYDW